LVQFATLLHKYSPLVAVNCLKFVAKVTPQELIRSCARRPGDKCPRSLSFD
jgi:hypothetical protein